MFMLKKLFLCLLIIFILYIIAIFKAPIFAENIEKFLNIEWFNEWVIEFKAKMDIALTNAPTKEELKDAYNKTLSWAEEFKDIAWSWTQEIKDKIDWVRLSLSWSIDSYNWVRKDVLDTKERIEQTIESIKETWEMIDSLSNLNINSSGSLETN